MSLALLSALIFSLGCAFAAIVLGRNLTRSITAGFAFIAALAVAFLLIGLGYGALSIVILGALTLGTLQLYGWMLVDADRDHLPPTDRATWAARGLAFLILGGGLGVLLMAAFEGGEFSAKAEHVIPAMADGIGSLLFGQLRDITILMGFAFASSLLATLLLLQEGGEDD